MLLIKPLLALRPSKTDWIFALKTFAAGMLALYIAFSLNLAYPIWAIGTVFVIANPYSGISSSKSMYRVLGTLLGAIVAVIATPPMINTPWLFTLFLAIWVGFCLYISLLDRTPRSYVFMLAGYTTVIISFTIIFNIDTATVFDTAIGRFIEISLGVLCSAAVMNAVLPMSIGKALEQRVSKILHDTHGVFDEVFHEKKPEQSYIRAFNVINRDISDIHVMATHLSYERSKLSKMTKPLQEMLHQLSLIIANLVAMSERMNQLKQLDPQLKLEIQNIHQLINTFLQQDQQINPSELNLLPNHFEYEFDSIIDKAQPSERVILHSLKMDLRHFIQNTRAIRLIWQRIQQGNYALPESIIPLTTTYPTLHRDHGVAVRGGISAFIVVIISTGIWILSGWQYGYMFAEMATITACILTSLDNPVPALKMFIRANIYAAILVFIYAFGIFPSITEYWQLVVALAPMIIFSLLLFPHPPLTGLGLPLLMGAIMGLNLQNSYHLNPISYIDGSLGSIMGPIISVLIIHFIRAMSPDITAQRILSLHYTAVRDSLYLPYGLEFKIHLRSMLDRIAILNTKPVQSDALKQEFNLALIECSAVIDLTRLQELMHKISSEALFVDLESLRQQLNRYYKCKAQGQDAETARLTLISDIEQLRQHAQLDPDDNLDQRLKISLNNIQYSLCHVHSAV